MRLIDAGQIVYSWFVEEDGTMSDGITLQSIINRLPTIDAVPVIRCKDCKYYHKAWDGTEKHYYEDYWCEWVEPDGNDFCSLAERRSDG